MRNVKRKELETKRAKVAKRISVLLSDFTLDLEKIGYYIARDTPYLIFNRAIEVLESAQFQKPIVDKAWKGTYDDKFYR